MAKTLTPTKDNTTDWFATEAHQLSLWMKDFLKQGQQIARRYVAAVDRDPTFYDFLIVQYPDIPSQYWRRIERVGRGQLDVRIVAGNASWGNKLEKLPLSDQKRALDDRLPLLLENGDVLHVSVSDIRQRQADQLFAFDHIRDLAAQRAFIENQKLEEEKKRVKTTDSAHVGVAGADFLVGGKLVPRKKLASYIKALLKG